MKKSKFGCYLKSKLPLTITLAVIFALYLFILCLYQAHTQVIVYSFIVTVSLLIVYYAFDFIKYCSFLKKIEIFTPMTDNIKELNINNEVDKIWLSKINDLKTEMNAIITATDLKQAETKDYYVMWAHQIKTPIAGLKLLLENDLNDKNLLKCELFKVENYVEMVLGYARLDSIEHDFSFTNINVDDIIKNVAKKFSLQFILLKLTFDFCATKIIASTDEKWLQFVIEQFFSNSLKYTQKGKISVCNEGQKLIIQDTGIGIKSEDLPRITERGFTGFNGRFDKKSTGLGLYLSSKILAKLNIALKIDSTVNVGTKITLDFSNITKK